MNDQKVNKQIRVRTYNAHYLGSAVPLCELGSLRGCAHLAVQPWLLPRRPRARQHSPQRSCLVDRPCCAGQPLNGHQVAMPHHVLHHLPHRELLLSKEGPVHRLPTQQERSAVHPQARKSKTALVKQISGRNKKVVINCSLSTIQHWNNHYYFLE